MCLAVPARVEAVAGGRATVDLGGVRIVVDASLLPDLLTGEHVLIHAGFAIQRLSADRASATQALLQELREDG